ncbi:MAG TPA: disulfide bond formation protein B [Rhodospirillum rubrum]|nr:disulfide bond formation protein B [Rhodospirillum rubrum]
MPPMPAACPFRGLRLLALALLLVSGGALMAALYAEFALGLEPCVLCLYERGPWVLAALLCAIAFQPGLDASWRRRLLGLCALAFFGNALLAGFHIGVEQHWWAGTDACGPTAAGPGVGSLGDLRAAMSAPAPATARCDTPSWTFHGLTLAGLNLILSLILGGVTGWRVLRRDESHPI